jgi:thiamine-phosphate pyrophosphorylase
MRKRTCELYLTIEANETAAARLAAALDAVPVAAVLIAPAPNRPLDAAAAKPLIDLVQAKGIAALVYGDAALAQALAADGVHLPSSPLLATDYASARKILGPGLTVGIDAGASRHDAMEMAEAAADYIAFATDATAIPTAADDDADDVDADGKDITETVHLISWWVDIFQTPCVALGVKTTDDAARIANLGCEFICVALEAGLSPAATAEFVRTIAGATA